MAGAKEIFGTSIMERSSLISSTKFIQTLPYTKKFPVLIKPNYLRGKRLSVRPVAAVSEDYYLIKTSQPSDLLGHNHDDSGDAKFKVRAVVTVRNKIKEDLKEALVKHIDNLSDKIGRNVVLQLVSSEIDPSMLLFSLLFTSY